MASFANINNGAFTYDDSTMEICVGEFKGRAKCISLGEFGTLVPSNYSVNGV